MRLTKPATDFQKLLWWSLPTLQKLVGEFFRPFACDSWQETLQANLGNTMKGARHFGEILEQLS